MRKRTCPKERFWPKVDKTGECWLWTAGTWCSRGGDLYGQFWDGEHKITAHRFAYKITYGDIPDHVQIDHRCQNTLCVRPDHLREATNKQNHEHLSGPCPGNTSGILGVSWKTDRRRWIASVGHYGALWQRSFSTLEEAAMAVKAKRLELFTHNDMDRM